MRFCPDSEWRYQLGRDCFKNQIFDNELSFWWRPSFGDTTSRTDQFTDDPGCIDAGQAESGADVRVTVSIALASNAAIWRMLHWLLNQLYLSAIRSTDPILARHARYRLEIDPFKAVSKTTPLVGRLK